jgi:hypothetical protein
LISEGVLEVAPGIVNVGSDGAGGVSGAAGFVCALSAAAANNNEALQPSTDVVIEQSGMILPKFHVTPTLLFLYPKK